MGTENARATSQISQPRVIAVDLDADKSVLFNRDLHQIAHAAAVPGGMNERQSIESVGPAGDDARNFVVGGCVVGMKRREEHGAIDTGACRPAHILAERRGRIPRAGETVALSRVAMGVYDHFESLSGEFLFS
jgi:hypothetical protein